MGIMETPSHPREGARPKPGDRVDWIVNFHPSSSTDSIREWCQGGATTTCIFGGNPSEGGMALGVVRSTAAELEELLRRGPRAMFVEPDLPTFSIPEIIEDEEVSSWGLDRVDDRYGLDGSFDVTADGGTGVHVYVADTGIRTTHADFGGRAVPTLEVVGSNVSACSPSDTECASDRHGHGTHCAGTVGGATYGVARSATLHAVKVLLDDGSGAMSWLIAAIDWVVTRGQRPAVFSASLGFDGKSPSAQVAVDRASASGITVVVAAGNGEADACEVTPAFVPSAITVGATRQSDSRAAYSNFGPCVDLFAPGSDITSADAASDDAWAVRSGTSMACPHVAGAAALLLGANGSRTPAEVQSLLKSSATAGAVGDVRGTSNLLLYIDPEAFSPAPAPKPGQQLASLTSTLGQRPPVTTASTPPASSSPLEPSTPAATSTSLPPPASTSTPLPLLASTSTPPVTTTSTLPASSSPREPSTPAATSTSLPPPASTSTPLPPLASTSTSGQRPPMTTTSTPPASSSPLAPSTPAATSTSVPPPASTSTPLPPLVSTSTPLPPPASTTLAAVLPPPAPSPPPPTDFWVFRVDAGECVVEDDCVTSPNFPEPYGRLEMCAISVNATFFATHVISVEAFETEDWFDVLVVNGQWYSGNEGPDGVQPIEAITWWSDASYVASGWKLCTTATEPTVAPPVATPAPTGMFIYRVDEGPCVVDDENCVMSPHFPEPYGNSETCTIAVNETFFATHVISVEAFETEEFFDVMIVNRLWHSGSEGPDGVQPTDAIVWSSDFQVVASGWKLCSMPAEPTPTPVVPTHTPVRFAFWVDEGPCLVDDGGCVASPHFPEPYGNLEICVIAVNATFFATHVISVEAFETEKWHDVLEVNGERYSGNVGPDGVQPTEAIVWWSNRWDVAGGWKLCSRAIPTPAPAKFVYRVDEGPCVVDDWGCVTSPHYPEPYGNFEICVIDVNATFFATHVISVEAFETEEWHDVLEVNGERYSGNVGPDGVQPTEAIVWWSNRWDVAGGWKLCSRAVPTPAPVKFVYRVDEGPCVVDDWGCVTSPYFPEPYGNFEICVIAVNATFFATHVISVEAFETEDWYDVLEVNGEHYSGNVGPDGVQPTEAIVWWSNRWDVAGGWKLCSRAAEPTPAPVVPAPPPAVFVYRIDEGPCVVDDGDCVMSPHFPEPYGNFETCVIAVNATFFDSHVISVEAFETEEWHDVLEVNGEWYSGNVGPDGVQPTEAITWWSDREFVANGWKLCTRAADQTAPPHTTLAPTSFTTYRVDDGNCVVDGDDCVTSPNYPEPYGVYEGCEIAVNTTFFATYVISVEAFETEDRFDELTVNGVAYSGSEGPDGVQPTEAITWWSDSSVVANGWKLCARVVEHESVPVASSMRQRGPTSARTRAAKLTTQTSSVPATHATTPAYEATVTSSMAASSPVASPTLASTTAAKLKTIRTKVAGTTAGKISTSEGSIGAAVTMTTTEEGRP